MKRIFDFSLALLGLFISFPLWAMFALLIWLEDRRHIFYLQERVGLAGQVFKSIKFRSMICSAEEDVGPLQSYEGDPRVTRLGRLLRATAMDELPQLWNILKGEMSFVGPRALRPLEIDGPDNKIRDIRDFPGFSKRCSIRPGLTGVAQVLAPRDISRHEKFRYDIWYIDNQNLWLDIKLIAFSFLVTFSGRWEAKFRGFRPLTESFRKRVICEISQSGV